MKTKSATSTILLRLAMLVVICLPGTVGAHPGHALTDASVSHLITSPYHAAALGLLGLACWCAAALLHRKRAAWFMRGMGIAMTTGAVWMTLH